MIALLLLQVAGPMLDTPRPVPPACGAAARPGGDIVVCGRGQQDFRLRAVPERYDADAAALPKAETGILGGKAVVAAEAERAGVAASSAIGRWCG